MSAPLDRRKIQNGPMSLEQQKLLLQTLEDTDSLGDSSLKDALEGIPVCAVCATYKALLHHSKYDVNTYRLMMIPRKDERMIVPCPLYYSPRPQSQLLGSISHGSGSSSCVNKVQGVPIGILDDKQVETLNVCSGNVVSNHQETRMLKKVFQQSQLLGSIIHGSGSSWFVNKVQGVPIGIVDDEQVGTLNVCRVLRREVSLHEACKHNDIDTVRSILKEKVDINCKNNLDRTPLHWACAKGHLQIVELLVDMGADLEAKDKYGMRPVLWAALYGHLDVLRYLVNTGATATCTNRQGMGLLHCATQNNHIHVMNFVFESLENVDINCSEKNDKTALHIAAEEGHLHAVMRLIDLRCDVNKRDMDCSSPLHLAAKQGHHEVVKRLLMVGVNVDDRDADGRTALHLAADAGHLDTVEVLIDFNAGANAETIKEITPFHVAAAKGHTEVCQRLILYGANINSQNHQGNTALHLSVMGNFRDLSQALVNAKAEIDLPNHRLQTPLHVAVESGFQDVVEVLLVGNASLSAREKSGKTALHLAARGSFVTIVDMIIKAERYFSLNREYHENDLDFIDPHRYLRQPTHPSWPQMKQVLWNLATKSFKPGDWKRLASYWKFTPDHIRCVEHQYTGTASFKEHGFRLLMIWLHGVRKDENVTKLLFEGLVAIDRRPLAEQIRRQPNCEPEKPCIQILCGII